MERPQRTLVILGAGGDLTSRLLLPGLGQLLASSRSVPVELIGVGPHPMADDEWRALVARAFESGGAGPDAVAAVLETTRFIGADATDPDDLRRVLGECSAPPALYFALPPSVTVASCAALEEVGLPEGAVLALEKPFGTDRQSAQDLNRQLAKIAPESSIHRVDHFIGKSTVLNLLGLRFANRIFESAWGARDIERVEIVYDEALGLEGRAGYYDRAGAMVDMIQSHLLLVLALIAMEPPSALDPDDLRGAMVQALRAARAEPGGSRRARYGEGSVEGRSFPAYVDEPGVDPERETETLAEITVRVENWRWAGVPFVLRSGKALGTARKHIRVTFRPVPHALEGMGPTPGPQHLTIALAPDTLTLGVLLNGAGDPFDLDEVTFQANFGTPELGAYAEVLHGILTGDPLLSVRGDIAEECWRIVDDVLREWRSGAVPLETYPTGTAGPPSWPS